MAYYKLFRVKVISTNDTKAIIEFYGTNRKKEVDLISLEWIKIY